MKPTAPNERLAVLEATLGEADTRELVRLFLASAPKLIADIGSADRTHARRAAHSLKSSSLQMGLMDLSRQALEIEARLDAGGPAPSPIELSLLSARVRRAEANLRGYAGA